MTTSSSFRNTVGLAVAFAFIAGSSTAEARSFRVNQIPNGSSYTCDSCHGKRSLSPAELTPFGVDVNERLQGDDVVWSALWQLDSDGDGFTNGLELGDPNGTWQAGDPNPDAPTANPGIPNGGICGNGDAEPGEDCDGANLRGESCQSLGFGEGTLTCHPLCRWDARNCGTCGDGYRNPDFEDCDGEAFPEALSCEEFGFLRGELSCDDQCEIDLSTCTDEKPAVCGDGVISTGELCDGDNLGTVDCQRIAYAGGTLSCTDECKWDASDCLFADGRRVGDEERAAEDTVDGSPDAGGVVEDTGTPTGSDDRTTRIVGEGGSCSTVATSHSSLLVLGWMLVASRSRRRSDAT